MKTEFQYGICDFALVSDNLINCRNIEKLPENAKSIITFAFPYKIKAEKPLNISRYAAVADYHNIVPKYLQNIANELKQKYPNNEFVVFCDNSPIPEVQAGVLGGLGVRGKNGLLINDKYGSFVFLGEIVTDLYIKSENTYNECINCGACLKACPVKLNKENCLSAVTQKKKELSETEKELIKKYGSVWGCDICSEVCPMNKGKEFTNVKEFIESYRNEYTLNESIENRAYAWRGEGVIKRNYNILCGKK
ncbi:MAG: QueG-associated DUF1730 domain-containing protein [Acutalibacteraceae bacterium]|nr:QueG-associated DUF1730 domain-containing protein [Acutalibacteraceae bacterium]